PRRTAWTISRRCCAGSVLCSWQTPHEKVSRHAKDEGLTSECLRPSDFRVLALALLSTIRITEGSGGLTLASSHDSRPQGVVAPLMSIPMFLFKGVARKALLQDLNDVKAAVEREGSVAA